jgi:hypothetical protein
MVDCTFTAIYLSIKNSFFGKAVDKEGDATSRSCKQGSKLAHGSKRSEALIPHQL